MDLKSTFETLKGKASDLAQAGVAQSKRLAEIAKLKGANKTEEDAIRKAYLELGKLYYAENGAAPEGAYTAACEQITASKALIETNNERIAELKQSVNAEVEADLEDAMEIAEAVEIEKAVEIEGAAEAEETAEAAEKPQLEQTPVAGNSGEEDKQD